MKDLKEAIKRKLIKEANLLRFFRTAPKKLGNVAKNLHAKVQVGAGNIQRSPLYNQLKGDANFLGGTGGFQGTGLDALPLGTMAQQGKSLAGSLYRKTKSRFNR